MSIELELPNARWLKDIILAVHELVDDALLVLTPDGVQLTAMDAGKVALIHFELPKVLFTEYVYTQEAPDDPEVLAPAVHIGLNWAHVKAVFTDAKEQEPVRLNFKNPLEIQFPERPPRTFSVPLLDPMDLPGPHQLPKLDWPCTFHLDAKYLHSLVKTLARFADCCEVQILGDGEMIWRTVHEANETPQAEIQLTPTDPPVYQWKTAGTEARAVFTLSYLTKIMKHLSKVGGDTTVMLRVGHDLPLKVDVSLRPITPPHGGGMIGWYVAPRIEVE